MNDYQPSTATWASDNNPFPIWGEQLLADPTQAVDDILTGRGARDNQQQAEPEDFFADLVDSLHWATKRDDLLMALDETLFPWLLQRSRWELATISDFGVRAHAAQFTMALAVVARLPLPRTAHQLTEQQPYWDRHCETLRWSHYLDLRCSYNKALIAHQSDERFIPRWFTICESAAWGSPYWRAELSTGLLGLRKLPPQPGAQPERRAAMAVARFALLAQGRGNTTEGRQMLRRTAQSLTLFYSRSETHWATLWQEVLDALPTWGANRYHRNRLAQWLGKRLSTRHKKDQSKSATHQESGRQRFQLPDHSERDKLKREIGRANQINDELWNQFQTLMTEHWAYAQASREGFFAVRTLNDLGGALLRLNPDPPMLEELQAWTRQAIAVEPENAHSWGLWARLLAKLEQAEAALAMRWETVRRFPEDPVPRTELAGLLIRRQHYSVAEQLLHQTIQDFPRNAVCRTMLAELLRDTDRTQEAEQLLCQTIQDFPHDVVCQHILIKLLWSQNTEKSQAKAEQQLKELEGFASYNPYVRSLAARISTAASSRTKPLNLKGKSSPWRTETSPKTASFDLKTEEAYPPTNDLQLKTPTPGSAQDTQQGSEQDALSVYLQHLQAQIPWLEAYYANEGDREQADLPSESGLSELAPVLAWRRGQSAPLALWQRARPGSYAMRLLSAWRDNQAPEGEAKTTDSPLDAAILDTLAQEFPEFRQRHNWLRFPYLSAKERERMVAITNKKGKSGAALWHGRLAIIYPGIDTPDRQQTIGDRQALRQLVADTALACADRVPISATKATVY